MRKFAAKAAPSADKVRGGYYTPPPIAKFLAEWVAVAGPRLLEPSCGDGVVLRELSLLASGSQGVELIEAEAEKARHFAPVVNVNFFDWLQDAEYATWDGVAGNPPYIRFGNWASDQREPALQHMRQAGLKPNKLTNAWVPFVVGAATALRSGGRLGLVLPAELLQVSYAAQLRDYLLSSFSEITLVTFEKLVFDGILQEVVLLLGVKGVGPARIRTVQLADLDTLTADELVGPTAPTLLHEHEKWTKYFLEPHQITALRRLKDGRSLATLGQFASVDVGIVTGRNSFFTMTDEQAEANGLRDFCVPLVSRSAQLSGMVYDRARLQRDKDEGHRVWLLNAPESVEDARLAGYIAEGEADDVHLGYKCSIRRPWWRTPSLWVPDAFLLRQIHLAPRLAVNETDATSTDTVHRIRLMANTNARAVAAAFHNSATFAFCETMGRSYGGGILELEPREAEMLPIPDPALIGDGLAAKVAEHLAVGQVVEGLDLVDREVLIGKLGWSALDVATCRSAWLSLRDRRNTRGRKQRKPVAA